MLRISLAQLNPTIGDIEGNIALMRAAADEALAQAATVVVFPELSLTGYYPADLLEEPAFRRRIEAGLSRVIAISRETPSLHWVVGAPTANSGVGKRLHNSLLVVKAGEVLL